MHETDYRHNDDFVRNAEKEARKESSETFWSLGKVEEVSEKRKEVDRVMMKEVRTFVDALDSYKKWLTKKLLDIHTRLREIWWMDETTLWNESFGILLSTKEVDRMPDMIKEILGDMLKNLAEYDKIKKKKAIPLEKMMLACVSISAMSGNYMEFWDRVFMPWNIGLTASDLDKKA